MTDDTRALRAEPVPDTKDAWWNVVEDGENIALTDEATAKRIVAALAAAPVASEADEDAWSAGYDEGFAASKRLCEALERADTRGGAGLDVDDLERAMRAHILDDRHGWPHWRPGATPNDIPEPIYGCSDLCAADILARRARTTEEPT